MRPINSMIEFKQIIGRGTRLFDGKDYFTIYDFVKAYAHFQDPEWDGEPQEPVIVKSSRAREESGEYKVSPKEENENGNENRPKKSKSNSQMEKTATSNTKYLPASGVLTVSPSPPPPLSNASLVIFPNYLKMKTNCDRSGAAPILANLYLMD
jgi:type I site-specific restriction endonuclease